MQKSTISRDGQRKGREISRLGLEQLFKLAILTMVPTGLGCAGAWSGGSSTTPAYRFKSTDFSNLWLKGHRHSPKWIMAQ